MTVSKATLETISTPEAVDTVIGGLAFTDGVPHRDTVSRLYDHADRQHGVDAFLHSLSGASMQAVRKGFLDAGVADNSVLIFSTLMDSDSLFLTPNADTVYFWSYLDLEPGPLVVETPPQSLGIFDDMWFR